MVESERELEERRDVSIRGLPICALSIHPTLAIAIVVRKCGENAAEDVVEQYNVRSQWMARLERRFSVPGGGRVESAAWVGDLALLTLLDGRVAFVDPHSVHIKTAQVAASALFAATALSEKEAVIISHSSILYFLDVSSRTVLRSLSLGVDTRLFSVAACDNLIAVGGLDCVWLVEDGKEAKRELHLERAQHRLPTVVWAVTFVRPRLLATGDSRGVVSLWDTVSCASLATFKKHEADVLSLASFGGNLLCAAGVDPSVMFFEEIKPQCWVDTLTKRIATRDVCALATFSNRVYGGGADERLFRFQPQPAFLPTQVEKSLCVAGELCMQIEQNGVKLWTTTERSGSPRLLFHVFTPKKVTLTASAVSRDGRWLSLSTSSATSTYKLEFERESDSALVERVCPSVLSDPSPLPSANLLLYSHDSKWLFIAAGDTVYRASAEHPQENAQVCKFDDAGVVVNMAVSDSCEWLAVITTRGLLFRVAMPKWSSPAAVPVLCPPPISSPSLPIEVAFLSNGTLFVLSSDALTPKKETLFELPVPSGRASGRAKSCSPPLSWCSRHFFPKGWISSITGNGEELLIASDLGTWAILSKEMRTEDGESQRRILCEEDQMIPDNPFERKIAAFASRNGTLRVYHPSLAPPTTAAFRSKKYGLQ